VVVGSRDDRQVKCHTVCVKRALRCIGGVHSTQAAGVLLLFRTWSVHGQCETTLVLTHVALDRAETVQASFITSVRIQIASVKKSSPSFKHTTSHAPWIQACQTSQIVTPAVGGGGHPADPPTAGTARQCTMPSKLIMFRVAPKG
jgi:hypothetical protein